MKRKILIIFLIIVMLIFNSVNSYSASKKYDKYLSLGDSISSRHGLSNPDDRFVVKIKEIFNISDVNFIDLSERGMTAKKFNEIIREEKYRDEIEQADLITISIGSNELLNVVRDIFIDVSGIKHEEMLNVEGFSHILQSKISGNNIDNIKEMLELLEKLYNIFSSPETEQIIKNRIEQYKNEWSEAINFIKEINPEATIVVLEFYNPYSKLVFIYDFGSICKEYINIFNNILYELSDNETKYKIAKISEEFETDSLKLTNVSLDLSSLSIDPHPNKEGHSVIAKSVEDAINREIVVNETKMKSEVNSNLVIFSIIFSMIVILITIIIKKYYLKLKNK